MKRMIIILLLVCFLTSCLQITVFAQSIDANEEARTEKLSVAQWNDLSDKKAIKLVQEMLIDHAYLYGSADGVIGNQTISAVIKYKTINGFKPVNADIDYDLYCALCDETGMAYDNELLQSVTYKYWQYTIEASNERGDYYDSMVAAISDYEKLKKQGKTGTKTFHEIEEMIIPEGYDADAYIKVLKKYFTSNDNGIWNFAKAISKRDSTVIRYWESGSTYNYEIKDYSRGVNRVCMQSELSLLHTCAVLGKMFDCCDEYTENPWIFSWALGIRIAVEFQMENN